MLSFDKYNVCLLCVDYCLYEIYFNCFKVYCLMLLLYNYFDKIPHRARQININTIESNEYIFLSNSKVDASAAAGHTTGTFTSASEQLIAIFTHLYGT